MRRAQRKEAKVAKQTVIREDRLGMWTVTYPDGAEQHFNNEADAQSAATQAGATDVVVEPYDRGGCDTSG